MFTDTKHGEMSCNNCYVEAIRANMSAPDAHNYRISVTLVREKTTACYGESYQN